VTDEGTELAGRLKVIETQALDTRAEAYAALHAELAARLGEASGTGS
jgi:hypothetical protein